MCKLWDAYLNRHFLIFNFFVNSPWEGGLERAGAAEGRLSLSLSPLWLSSSLPLSGAAIYHRPQQQEGRRRMPATGARRGRAAVADALEESRGIGQDRIGKNWGLLHCRHVYRSGPLAPLQCSASPQLHLLSRRHTIISAAAHGGLARYILWWPLVGLWNDLCQLIAGDNKRQKLEFHHVHLVLGL